MNFSFRPNSLCLLRLTYSLPPLFIPLLPLSHLYFFCLILSFFPFSFFSIPLFSSSFHLLPFLLSPLNSSVSVY